MARRGAIRARSVVQPEQLATLPQRQLRRLQPALVPRGRTLLRPRLRQQHRLALPAGFDSLKKFVNDAERLQDNDVSTRSWQTSHTLSYDPTPSVETRVTFGLNNRFSQGDGHHHDEFADRHEGVSGRHDRPWRRSRTSSATTPASPSTSAGSTARRSAPACSIITSIGAQLFRNDDGQVSYTATNVRDGAQTLPAPASRRARTSRTASRTMACSARPTSACSSATPWTGSARGQEHRVRPEHRCADVSEGRPRARAR